jgi:hypothetical protein
MARILEPSRGSALAIAALTGMLSAACSTPSGEGEGSETATPSETGTGTETEPETGPEPETTETETGDTEGDPPRPERIAVTADWRSQRLSLLDYGALRDGALTREAALWKTIELPNHAPGPLEVELTPDGALAIVAISPGFFGGAGGGLVGVAPGSIPAGEALLILDVDSGMILAELAPAQAPMGIAIAPDGRTAWTANYGGNGQSGTTVSVIDLERLSISAQFEVGPGPEQIDLSADGSLAIVNTAGDGAVRLFATADPSATLSPSLVVSDDPSWVLLLDDGMDRAVAINSLGPSGYSLLDVGDPSAPAILDTVAVMGIAYAAAPGRTPSEILLSMYVGSSASLKLYDVDTGTIVDQIDLDLSGFPLGIVFDPVAEIALVPMPGANVLVVADFGSGEHRVLDWQTEVGPTYVSLE